MQRGVRGSLYAGIAALVALAGWAYMRRAPRPPAITANSYVDSALCAGCHRTMADGLRRTGMGRSFARLRPENAPAAVTFYHRASDTHFSMLRRGEESFQRRWQVGFDGKETNVEEKRVDYVMGSGNHSRTYFHLTGRNTLQQLPLHWYAEGGGTWAMSPGYDRPDHPGSTRLAGYECMFCHNAYPRIPKGNEAAGAEWVFLQPLPEGIDCQRCHGPGKRHVELAGAGAAPERIREAIVNPKRLEPQQAMEVCMQCHLHTTAGKLPASMERADRGPFSYVAGEPLGNFRLSFDRAVGKNERFENLGSAYRLRRSQCFLKSEGKLQCITCHNPHKIPRGEAATAHYNAKCRDCHRAVERPAHTASADCVSCHMPKRRTDDEVHVVMTDHFIQRLKPAGDLLAPKVEMPETASTQYRGEVALYYPPRLAETAENSLDLARAQIRDGSNLTDGLTRLASLVERHRPASAVYYADLAEGYVAAGDAVTAAGYYEEAARRQPDSAFRLTKLASALVEVKQFPKAEEALRRATVLAPSDALAWGLLGWALWQQDKTAEARAALEKGVSLDPDMPELHNHLASLEGGTGDLAAAEKELRAALRILPGIEEWQLNLGRLLATRGELAEGQYHFEQAIRLKPDDAVAHLDFARVLVAKGDRNRALEQLRIAARGGDPQIRASAEQLLQQLGR